jgi:hypothetical protein
MHTKVLPEDLKEEEQLNKNFLKRKGMGWICVAPDGFRCRLAVNTVMTIWIP